MRALACLAALLAAGGCRPGPRTAAPLGPPSDEQVPFGPDARVAELAFLRDVLLETYVHLEDKRRQWGADPAALFDVYRPLAERADTWARVERVMVAYVSEFHDAHLAWRRRRRPDEPPRRIVRLGLETRFVGPDLIVSAVWPGSDAARAGLRVGDLIVGMDGETVEQRLGGRASLRSWSRLEAGRHDFADEWPATRVLRDQPLAPRRITRQRTDGQYETLPVLPETRPPEGRDRAPVRLAREGCVAVLRVRTLTLPEEVVDRELPALARAVHEESCGLVLDLRDNPGGAERAARQLAGLFLHRPVTGAHFRVRLSPRALAARPAWRTLPPDRARPGWSLPQPLTLEPRAAAPAPGRTVLLVDPGCRSWCETVALTFRAAGATLVGERTGGSTGAPIPVPLPTTGARVTVPVWAVFAPDGRPVEGLGVVPDETVTATREDVVAGRDPARARAVARAAGE